LAHAADAAELAQDVCMGVLFSRGADLDHATIERRCLEITSEGQGTIAISSFLAPNTVLLLGQGRTIDRFQETMHDILPKSVHLKKNAHRWPPMHTSLTRQRSIPDKASVMLERVRGGFTAPTPPILSCVTGDVSYNETNSREILNRWIDHPQQLWDVVDKLLAKGVETIIHVGPEPNILPATFKRLVIDITSQLSARSLAGLGLRAISRIVRKPRAWLTRLISSDATLLRAPFVEQIILEDWLLEQQPA
jgi:[acyl-carrier-protein] S-malonyltransferase